MADIGHRRPSLNKRSLLAGATILTVVAIALVYSLQLSFSALSFTADKIDDIRSQTAVEAAIGTLQRQLGSTIRDNAYWEDAFIKLGTPQRDDWAVTTWGIVTEDYPLYDAFVLLGSNGRSTIGYYKGAVVDDPSVLFDPSLQELVRRARAVTTDDPIPTSFISSRHGLMLIGAATVRPLKTEQPLKPQELDVLVFAKEITPRVIEDVSRSFSIRELQVNTTLILGQLSAKLADPYGRPISYFAWPPEKPGSKSFELVKPTVYTVAVILVLFLVGIVWSARVFISKLQSHEAAARYEASHDALTGLLNRIGFSRRLEPLLQSGREAPVFIHLLDLDEFKQVNDSWGHAVGDTLLAAVSERITRKLPTDCCFGRFGGDEFAVMSADDIGEQIVELFRTPFDVDSRTIYIRASIGTAVAHGRALSLAELVRRADVALHRAKGMGKARAVTFTTQFDIEDQDQKELECDLRLAVVNCEIEVVFQPILSARSRKIVGVEALARWHHPRRGYISPDRFIKVAERSGTIDGLGRLVLCRALTDMLAYPGMSVSVNVSPYQLNDPTFVNDLRYLLDELQFEPSLLVLEVTEGVLITNPEIARQTMAAIQALGIKLALDDFGCGYASFGTLRSYTFDKMKLDRSLTSGRSQKDIALVQAAISLASALDIPVTAEGIETEDQAKQMEIAGCRDLQGYLFSRPITIDMLAAFMAEKTANDLQINTSFRLAC